MLVAEGVEDDPQRLVEVGVRCTSAAVGLLAQPHGGEVGGVALLRPVGGRGWVERVAVFGDEEEDQPVRQPERTPLGP